MSNDETLAADPVDYPVVRIGGKEERLRIGVSALVRLNKAGINIFEPAPYSAEWNEWAGIVNQIAEAGTLEESERLRLQTEAQKAWNLIPQSRREWRNPLSRGNLADQLAITTAVVAASLSTVTRTVTAEEIQDRLEMDEVKPLLDALIIAVKKVTAQLGV